MNRDANQIAKEHARREQRVVQDPVRHQQVVPNPNWGEFTILSGFHDDAVVLSRNPHVQVTVGPDGVILLTHMDGGKTLFKPVEGWCMIFEPDDAEG